MYSDAASSPCVAGNAPVYAAPLPLNHRDHPLYTQWHRYHAVVAVGPVGGLAAATALHWARVSGDESRYKLPGSTMDAALLPRTILLPLISTAPQPAAATISANAGVAAVAGSASGAGSASASASSSSPRLPCGHPAVYGDTFDAVVCIPTTSTSGNPFAPTHSQPLVLHQQSRPGPVGFSHVFAAGPPSSTHASVAGQRAVQLAAIVADTIAFQRSRAWVELQQPRDGQWTSVESGPVVVRVKVHNFEVPGEGSWSIHINGTQVAALLWQWWRVDHACTRAHVCTQHPRHTSKQKATHVRLQARVYSRARHTHTRPHTHIHATHVQALSVPASFPTPQCGFVPVRAL